MPETNLHPDEEVEETTPDEGSGVEESDSTEETSAEDQIAKLTEEVERLKKGTAKFFSENGKKQEVSESAKPTESLTDVEAMFFETKPEAELVADDLRTIAKAKGISVVQAWREESWLQEKGKSLSESQVKEATNLKKVSKPTTGGGVKTDYTQMTVSEIESLSVAERLEAAKQLSELQNR